MIPEIVAPRYDPGAALAIDGATTAAWLEGFLRDELVGRRAITRAVLGLSGGIDSALTAVVAADALGPERVRTVMLPSFVPWRTSWLNAS